ncbi:PAS domain-containing protein [Spirosoma aureum]|uniref:histidine kinase n=1 Tax=Spirosoma aureum TaxID=2692134 RepID=A0A6G9AN70_9BACT|nr:ATP-binding protein [Spirosoma aureum]QIP13786.1 PAS domain-containing protein [Spirosoma aureum]
MDANESPELLQAVLANSLTNIYAANAVRHHNTGQIIDFRITLVNPTFRDRSGFSGEHLRANSLLTLYPELSQSTLFERFIQVIETGQPFRGEEYFPNRSSSFWYDMSLSKFDDGIVVNFIDVTAKHQTQQEILQQAQLLQATLDGSISSILAVTAIRDEHGQIIDFRMDKANQAVERSLSIPPEQIEGRKLLEMFPGNVENGFFDLYVQVAETGIPQQATQHYKDGNGLDGWFEVSAVRQSPEKVVITFFNVTESKRLERKLRDSNQSLNEFAAIASHDLQEPLRKITSFSQLLIEQYAQALGDGVDLVNRMQSAAKRMQMLIKDLLDYSSLSKDEATAHHPVDLDSLVNEVLTDLEFTVQETRAKIEVGELCILMGNSFQLRQVFQNLLSNALKFTKPGVPPHIKLSCDKKTRAELPTGLRLLTKPIESYCQITVADQGIGFDEAYRDKIFDAFHRLHGRNSPYMGTGIGLAIVRKVMDNHDGGVTAFSRQGEGTSFALYFPAIVY